MSRDIVPINERDLFWKDPFLDLERGIWTSDVYKETFN